MEQEKEVPFWQKVKQRVELALCMPLHIPFQLCLLFRC